MSTFEIVMAALGLAASTVLAFLGLRRGSKADDDAQDNAAHAQVYAGYGGLLQRLEQDNAELRRQVAADNQELRELRQKVLDLEKRLSELEKRDIDIATLMREDKERS